MSNPFKASETIYFNSFLKNELQSKENSTLFYTVVSGAHLYGMESPNSDIDIRGVFVTNTHNLLGLHKPNDCFSKNTHQVHASQPEHSDGIDIVLHEIAKETNLALKSNCNIIRLIEFKYSDKLIHKPVNC